MLGSLGNTKYCSWLQSHRVALSTSIFLAFKFIFYISEDDFSSCGICQMM